MKKIWIILISGATIIAGVVAFFASQLSEKTPVQTSPETPAKTEPLGATTSTENQEGQDQDTGENEESSSATQSQQVIVAIPQKNNSKNQNTATAETMTSQVNTKNVQTENTTSLESETKNKTTKEPKEEHGQTHQEGQSSSGTNPYGAYNSYPWKDDCPSKKDTYVTYLDGHEIGGYVCESVSYASWKAYETYDVAVAWGYAYNWDDRARSAGYTVDNNPADRTIGQTDSDYYGHVFWVESVNGDDSINVTEYNNYYATGLLTGSYHVGDFGSRVISAGEAKGYDYIHFQ